MMALAPEIIKVDDLPLEHEWARALVRLRVMCTAVTDRDMHEVFDVPELPIDDPLLLNLYRETSDPKELDAIAHFVLIKNRPFDVLKQVVRLDNIDAMARFLKYVGGYPWSESLTQWMPLVMKETARWLSPDGVSYPSHCAFVTSFVKVMSENVCYENEAYLLTIVELLRASRQTGSLSMHEAILNTLGDYDRGVQDHLLVAGVDAIATVALYLDDDVVGHKAARLLKFKRLNASILPSVHAMSCRRKYLNDTVMLVNKIVDLPENETCTMILEQLLKHIKRPVAHPGETLMAIQALSSSANAGSICESMGDIMRLWLECPAANMDTTLDLVKGYMWTQRNFVSDSETSESD